MLELTSQRCQGIEWDMLCDISRKTKVIGNWASTAMLCQTQSATEEFQRNRLVVEFTDFHWDRRFEGCDLQ